MASITSWTRLEPYSRSADMRPGLRAEVRDPLWLLARQWQLGEFQATDAGSLVEAHLEADSSRLARYRPRRHKGPSSVRYDSDTLPLEALVEREPVQRKEGTNLRTAAEAGLQFLRLLEAQQVSPQLREAYRNAYPLQRPSTALDGESARFLTVMARRVPDGHVLYKAFLPWTGGPVTLPTNPPVPSADLELVRAAATAWLQWYEHLFSEPERDETSWVPERMEYEFAVAARTGHLRSNGELVLVAPEYVEGHLDWYSFDVNLGASLGISQDDPGPEPIRQTVLPTPVSYSGMPTRRWWEFEDAEVNFGKIEAGPVDLARMLLIEFASLYGNDHFVIPIDLEVGSICRITSLIVTDTFGDRSRIRPSGEATGNGSWQMFRLSPDRRVASQSAESPEMLFLPPVLGPSLQSPALEEVLFLNDEMANMAWAVERVVESPTGRPLNRFEAFQEERRRAERAGADAPPPPDSTAPLTYKLATSVPPYWIPLLPVRQVGTGLVETGLTYLQLRQMYDPETETGIEPQGKILKPNGKPLEFLYREEVPRAGARVTRAYQYARWTDASTHLWIGRRKQPGRGEGSSGLRFDVVEAQRS